jgi:hypothetical protein
MWLPPPRPRNRLTRSGDCELLRHAPPCNRIEISARCRSCASPERRTEILSPPHVQASGFSDPAQLRLHFLHLLRVEADRAAREGYADAARLGSAGGYPILKDDMASASEPTASTERTSSRPRERNDSTNAFSSGEPGSMNPWPLPPRRHRSHSAFAVSSGPLSTRSSSVRRPVATIRSSTRILWSVSIDLTTSTANASLVCSSTT